MVWEEELQERNRSLLAYNNYTKSAELISYSADLASVHL